MKVSHKKVVTLEYKINLLSGELVDSSELSGPFSYIHGIGAIIPGLEKGLEGMDEGEEKEISIPAEDAYGVRNEELVTSVSKSQFPEDATIVPGAEFYTYNEKGEAIPFTIRDINGETVIIDFNHPLAGEDLMAWVKVVSVREASPEEIAHGHVH